MHRWISASLMLAGLAVSPLLAQTAPPARRGAAPPTTKPAAPATQRATPSAPSTTLGPGTYARFVTSKGNFTARLFTEDAPKTVANFVGLATGRKAWRDPVRHQVVHRPLYNGTVFHRVIPAFMIQGGDPTGTGQGGTGAEFADEISPKYRFDRAGLVAMANHGPNTNDAQFFVTVAPYPSLNGHYSIFGEIVEGLDNVIAISRVPRGMSGENKDRPITPVVMKTVTIQTVK
jgi:peptidyl-prolyl cis-trans isomerase A (cyclophilin A)